MNKNYKLLGAIVSIFNLIYVFWLIFNVQGPLGYMFYIAEFMMVSLSVLFTINHWQQHRVEKPHHKPEGSLDVFLPVYNEDLKLFKKTVEAAKNIDYKNKKIYILDDKPRESVKKLAAELGINYIENKEKNFKKAGNLNYALKQTEGEFILVLDADQVAEPEIAKDILGYFNDDKKLAVITTRQKFDVPESDFNHDHLFYDHMQAGKHADNAAIAIGTGVFYRRSALKSIGNFQTWNVVEDLYTTFVFHKKGFKSMYINKAYTTGTAPQDLYSIYKQRGRWSHDTLRMFFLKTIFFSRELTTRQKLHYFELAWIYIVSAIGVPILFSLPALNLILTQQIILDPVMYVLLRIPTFILIMIFFYNLSRKNMQITQYWAGLFPVYLVSMVRCFFPVAKKHSVTPKLMGPGKRDIPLIIPQLFLVLGSYAVFIWRVITDGGISPETAVNGFWMLIMTLWFYPVILKGFKKE